MWTFMFKCLFEQISSIRQFHSGLASLFQLLKSLRETQLYSELLTHTLSLYVLCQDALCK